MLQDKRKICRRNELGVIVLAADVNMCVDMSERAESFYKSVLSSFENAVSESLLAEAAQEYENSTDRRKRYRFEPLKACLYLIENGKNQVILRVTKGGVTVIHERHVWADDVIVERENLTAKK